MATTRILIVDDEPDIRDLVGDILTDEGYEVFAAPDAATARELRGQHQPDLILLDVWMPDIDGVTLLREWRDGDLLDCPVVMISGHGSVETAVEATRLGAHDFIEKPVSMARLLATVRQALEAGRQQKGESVTRAEAPLVLEPLGRSAAVQQLKRRLERIASHDTAVTILGEAGTGKGDAARWIHAHSRRAGGPFVPVSEADGSQLVTLARQAEGGVLFIENIAGLDSSGQSALRRILEPAGRGAAAARGEAVNVRVLAGSQRDLGALVRNDGFDEALYYLLNVVTLDMPPLRERQEDVPDLVRFYAEFFPGRDGVPYRHFSMAAQNRLRQYDWPGNLRELKQLVRRLLIAGGDEVSADEVEQALSQSDGARGVENGDVSALFSLPLREAREAFERQYLTHRLKLVDGSVGKLAEVAEMERTHLYRKLRQLGIDPKQV